MRDLTKEEKRNMELLADRLIAELDAHDIIARIVGARLTNRFVVFHLEPAPGETFGKIASLDVDLARMAWVKSVRVSQDGGIINIEIPIEKPKPLRLVSLLPGITKKIGSATAVLGQDTSGALVLLKLASPDVVHALVSGMTGSGKTELEKTLITSLVLQHPASELSLLLVDPKSNAFKDFRGLPHLINPIVTETEDAVRVLSQLVTEMERRDKSNKKSYPLICCIDEVADLLMQDTSGSIEQSLTRLVQRGRSANIHLVCGTQRPGADSMPTNLKAQFPIKLVGRVSSPQDANLAAGKKMSGADRLLGRGDFLLIGAGVQVHFQVALTPTADIVPIVKRFAGEQKALPKLVELPDSTVEVSRNDSIGQLVARLTPWWAENGGVYGAKSAAVKYLFGKNAKPGGSNWLDTMQAIERIESSTSTTADTHSRAKIIKIGDYRGR